MKVSQALPILALFSHTITAASIPDAQDARALASIDARAPNAAPIVHPDHTLERRKGGGGRGGGGGSGGGRSGGGSSGRTSSGSSAGGQTRAGTGPARSFAGGRFYGGGAAVPYSAGQKTPKGLVAGALILPLAVIAIMPGLWLWSVYPYLYNNPYRFVNQTAVNATNPNGLNTTLPVLCLCQQYMVCGCDENDDQQYLKDLVGNGSYAALNKSLVTVAQYNGLTTLVLNGSLPNGTTAPGGTDDAAAGLKVGKYAAYYAVGLAILYGIML